MPTAPVVRARDLHARAVQLYNHGQPARALATLYRALSVLGASPERADRDHASVAARLWISIGLNESELQSREAGFAALATAEELIDDLDDPALRALLLCQRGLIELRGGSLAESRRSLDAAAELIERVAPREQSSVLINRGTVALLEGRLTDARADFERSAAIASSAGLEIEQIHSRHNLGYVEFLFGNLAGALRLMDEAKRISVSGESGIALLDLARVLIEAGLHTAADDALARASTIFRRHRVAQDLAETELERARCALALDDRRGARRFASAGRQRFMRRGNERWRRAAELVMLQADLADGRPGSRLAPPAERLAAEFEREGLRLHVRTARLIAVEAELAADRVDVALRGLARAGPAGANDPVTGRMHSHYVHARVDAARGARTTAARRVRRALDELARYQASFGSIDLRTAAAVHGRRLAALDITLAAESGRPVAVFAAAERARAVSSRLPPVRPPDDPVAAELLAELRQVIESLRPVEQDSAASAPILRRRRELERKIVERSWTVSGQRTAAPVAALAAVRAELAQRSKTMITYVHVEDRLSAVVAGAKVRLHDLGAAPPVTEAVRRVRADLDVLASPRLPAGLRTAVQSSLRHSLAALDEALLAPLKVDGPVVVVSTGVLGQLPWGSLPSLRGRPVEVVPSATKWLASAQAGPGTALRVAALAGPDLDRGADEATAVASVWRDAELRSGPDATTLALNEAARTATVLHIAAHGVHQPENPLFSSVRMVDGPVFAHELHQAGTAPDHVVLSACEVGLATIRPGDEALGLASVLLTLGTHSVIAGVARVGDEVAASTMAAYHQRLAAGEDSSAAIASALAEVDADVPPPFVNFGAAWGRPDGLHP